MKDKAPRWIDGTPCQPHQLEELEEIARLRGALAEAQAKVEALKAECQSLEQQRQTLEQQRQNLEHQLTRLARCPRQGGRPGDPPRLVSHNPD